MCPNHISFLDSVMVPLVLPRRISYVGKAEYLDSWKTKYLFPALGMIPIERSGGSASQRALDTAAKVLDRGELFGIYPRARAPVTASCTRATRARPASPCAPVRRSCPSASSAPTRSSRPTRRSPACSRCVVRFARPIDVGRFRERTDDPLVLRQITDEVMYEIRSMTGQEYVDEYATKQAEALPAETAVVRASA